MAVCANMLWVRYIAIYKDGINRQTPPLQEHGLGLQRDQPDVRALLLQVLHQLHQTHLRGDHRSLSQGRAGRLDKGELPEDGGSRAAVPAVSQRGAKHAEDPLVHRADVRP